MSANRYPLFILALPLVLAACRSEPRNEAVLKTGAAAVCDRDNPLVITVGHSGGYIFNRAEMDSAEVMRTLGLVLSPRPDRLVMVGNPTSAAVRWLVPAIEATGGSAYALDTACLPLPRGVHQSPLARTPFLR